MADPVDFGMYDCPLGDAWEGIQLLPELDADGNVVELSTYGSEWTATAKTSPSSTVSIPIALDQSNYNGSVDSSPTATRISVTLDGATTATMTNQQPYYCKLVVTGGGLSPHTYATWRLRIKAD